MSNDDPFESDDFSDDAAAAPEGDGSFTHDEAEHEDADSDWEEPEETAEDSAARAKAGGKRSSMIIIGAGIIVALLIIGFQFMHHSTSSSSSHPATVATQASMPPAPPTPQDIIYGGQKSVFKADTSKPQQGPSGGGLMNDPAALSNAESIEAAHSTASDGVPVESAALSPSSSSLPRSAPTPATFAPPGVTTSTMPLAPTPAPALTATPTSKPSPASLATSSQPLLPLPSSSTTTAAASLPSLSSSPPLHPAMSPPITIPAPDTATLSHIASRLDSMDNEIKQLQSLKEQVATLQQKVADLSTGSSTVVSSASPKTLTPLHHAAPRHHASADTSATAIAMPSSSGGGGWVLRSAQQGSAMISRGSDGVLTPVRVGDSEPGLGRIVAIDQHNGAWSVRGTSATISE